jgi:benzylsuccinate CoA-transferase BbsF subunit
VSKWRLDYTYVTDQRPDVIFLCSQGLGCGPYDGYETDGPNLPWFCGVTGQWAHPDDPHPVGTTLNHPDHMAGKQALVPLLAALLRREATGQGIFMEAAQVEASAYLIGERFLEQTFTLGDLAPLGNSSHDFAPHGCYPCAGGDRWVAIAIETDEQWQRLVQCCSPTSDELTHVDLSRRENRLAHTAQLDAWLGLWTSTRSPGEIETVLHNAGLPCSRVVTGDELATNATLHETGFFPTLDHARMGPREYTGMPVQVRGRGRVVVGPPPLLGEHTDDVLSRLDRADVNALRKSGVVGF